MATRFGVVDVGTNSVRVLVAEADSRDLRDVERDLLITRLGEGVDRERRLGDDPMRRTVAVIAEYVQRCRAAGATKIRVIATSAVRDAANREEFLTAVKDACGIRPDVLAGEEEARLGFAGATASIAAPEPYLVLDIGGGSTELVRGAAGAERFVSMDIGAVRLTERHIHSDPPTTADLALARADAEEHLARAIRVVGDEPVGTLVGLAGTITSAAAIHLGLEGYDRDAIHHARVPRAAVDGIRRRLSALTSQDRRRLPAMPRGREDVIVAGLVILESVMDRFGCGEVLVSESDILDGAALALARGLISPESPATR
ncbi:MAG: Ppx/GppA phosphatase family protein [Actinomycetota bacterium]